MPDPNPTVEVEALVSGQTVDELRQWSSLWTDLMHVDMVLLARDQVPSTPANVFTRRALWEGAVVAYGRMASGGRRQVQFSDVLSVLGPDAQRCHEQVTTWRDKHIAHRVYRSRETVTAHARIDPEQRRILGIRVRVLPAVGPEEDGEALVPVFKNHVYALRNSIWEQRIRPLESKIASEYAGQVEALLTIALPNPATPRPDRSCVQLDPS